MILMCNAIIIIMRAATPVAVMAAMKEDTPAEAIAAGDTKTHFFHICLSLLLFDLLWYNTIMG